MKNNLWLNWTTHCAAGELIGIAIAGGIAFCVNSLIGEPQTLAMKLIVLASMLVAGAIEGTVLSLFQWRVLKRKFECLPRQEWLFYTVIVAVLGWFLGILPSLFFIPANSAETSAGVDVSSPWLFAFLSIATSLALGAVFGLFQWFSLKKYATQAYKWIVANALGWGLGLGWIYLFASLPTGGTSLGFNIAMGICGGLLAGLSVGAITGLFLINLKNKVNPN